jgi:hypothetical protein
VFVTPHSALVGHLLLLPGNPPPPGLSLLRLLWFCLLLFVGVF